MNGCTVCLHPSRDAIETALAAGRGLRSIEKEFGVSRSALSRHNRGKCVKKPLLELVRSPACPPVLKQEICDLGAAGVIDRINVLVSQTDAILKSALDGNDPRLALAAGRECRENLALLARLTGELSAVGTLNQQQVNIGITREEYDKTISAIIRALEPFAEARQSVLAALEGVKVIECPPI
ncbi:MAG: hypothetical protein A4E35_01868 [Methanoregula sp. PtaU1.Bin051]|nr:MAG: hypothetical protein A4E35_01868 [Methanoregula sp. PtaU1.Bin051]